MQSVWEKSKTKELNEPHPLMWLLSTQPPMDP